MKKNQGFTLVELLVGILLMSIAWSMTMGILGNQLRSTKVLTQQMEVETNVRHLLILLEKQLKHSDCIIVSDDTLYLRDLETSSYMNSYRMEGTNLYKYKVYDNLYSIGLGSKSQVAANITDFQIHYLPEGRVEIHVESTWEDQMYSITKNIVPKCTVYCIKTLEPF